MQSKLKIVFGTIAVIGILVEGVELYFKPDAILSEASKTYPECLYWLRWLVVLGAAIGYFLMDLSERRKV